MKVPGQRSWTILPLLILVTSGLSGACAQDGERKLNVVVILVDDMGWTDLGETQNLASPKRR